MGSPFSVLHGRMLVLSVAAISDLFSIPSRVTGNFPSCGGRFGSVTLCHEGVLL